MEIDHITPEIVAAVEARIGKPATQWGTVDPRVLLATAHDVVVKTIGTPPLPTFVTQDPGRRPGGMAP